MMRIRGDLIPAPMLRKLFRPACAGRNFLLSCRFKAESGGWHEARFDPSGKGSQD